MTTGRTGGGKGGMFKIEPIRLPKITKSTYHTQKKKTLVSNIHSSSPTQKSKKHELANAPQVGNHTRPQTAGLKQNKTLCSAIFRVDWGISPRSAATSASHEIGKPSAPKEPGRPKWE